jgi:hypothetical protein
MRKERGIIGGRANRGGKGIEVTRKAIEGVKKEDNLKKKLIYSIPYIY